jgi:hypothetical protein
MVIDDLEDAAVETFAADSPVGTTVVLAAPIMAQVMLISTMKRSNFRSQARRPAWSVQSNRSITHR